MTSLAMQRIAAMVTQTTRVSQMLRYSMQQNTATRVQTEETSCARDWAIICRRVSVSLV